MLPAQRDYIDTKIEIDKYFEFLKKIEDDYVILSNLSDNTYTIDTELINILKANAYLLLYNLVEATIKNSIWEVYESIRIESVSYQKLRAEIQNITLHNKVKFDFKTKDETIANQVLKIVNHAFEDFSELFPKNKRNIAFESGNLNIERIKQTFKSYGLTPISQRHENQEESFKTTLRNRNNLAHGDQTFKDCGKSKSFQDLDEIKMDIYDYLERILIEIDDYISNKKYVI